MSLGQLNILKRLAASARAARIAVLSKLRSAPPPEQTPVQDSASHADICPPPPSISTDLVDLGLRCTDAETISLAFQRCAVAYKTRVEEEYAATRYTRQQTVRGDPTTLAKSNSLLATAFIATYRRALDSWRCTVIERVKQRICELKDARLQQVVIKPSFNASALPILEESFVQDSRPSRTEKQRLAARTNMEYKQISVWFQNRRNRSKKRIIVGNTSTDISVAHSAMPSDLAAALARILDNYTIPQEDTVHEEKSASTDLLTSFAPFHVDRPTHAWPACYPPLCSIEPFPLSADARGFVTFWYRTPVHSPTPYPASDGSDLPVLLERLDLGPEDTDWDRCGSRNSAAVKRELTTRLPPAPFRAATHFSSSTSRSQGALPPHRELCSISSRASYGSTRFAAATKIESHPFQTSHSPVAPTSGSKSRNQRRARSHDPPGTPFLPFGASFDTPASLLRGQPYPRGKPFGRKPTARSVPTTPRRPRGYASPAWASPLSLESNVPPSPPTTLPALSRESSVSSLRSVSSTSSSQSDSDLLLTPPFLPVSVLDYPVPELLTAALSGYARAAPLKGLTEADAPHGAAYLGYSMACGDHDPTLRMSSALYSQLELAAPFPSEAPLIPMINPSVMIVL